MIVLESNIKYLQWFGLFYKTGETRITFNGVLFNILVTFPFFLQLLGACAYFFAHIKNVVQMTHALYVVSAMSIYFLSYWTFALRKNQTRSIVAELQTIVNGSMYDVPEFFLIIKKNLLCFVHQ